MAQYRVTDRIAVKIGSRIYQSGQALTLDLRITENRLLADQLEDEGNIVRIDEDAADQPAADQPAEEAEPAERPKTHKPKR